MHLSGSLEGEMGEEGCPTNNYLSLLLVFHSNRKGSLGMDAFRECAVVDVDRIFKFKIFLSAGEENSAQWYC
jgi:hypothetical protein